MPMHQISPLEHGPSQLVLGFKSGVSLGKSWKRVRGCVCTWGGRVSLYLLFSSALDRRSVYLSEVQVTRRDHFF